MKERKPLCKKSNRPCTKAVLQMNHENKMRRKAKARRLAYEAYSGGRP